MLLYIIFGLVGLFAGTYAVKKVTGRQAVIPGTRIGTGGASQSSTKLEAGSEDARGVDVSSAQGVIDWAAVKAAGITFAIIKLTEGAAGIDSKAAFNMSGAGTNSILKLAYHFAHYQGDARQQAKFFAQKIKDFGGLDGPPCLDFEQVDSKTNLSPLSKAATCQWAKDFIDEMHNQGFPIVWIYSYPAYLVQLMPDLETSGLASLAQLWIADYGQTVNQSGDVADGAIPVIWKSSTYASVAKLWPTWVCWQTHGNDDLPKGSGRPRIPGIGNAVDHDRFNGTVKQLKGGLLV